MNPTRRWLRRTLGAIGVLMLCGVLAGYALIRPALRVGAGVIAHQMCSSTFVSGLPERTTREEMLPILIGDTLRWSHARVDRNAGTVDASLLLAQARAIYTPGWGCRLDFGEAVVPLPPRNATVSTQADPFAPASVVTTISGPLATALDREFADAPGTVARKVKAVVIVRDGRVVAERYAPGFGVDTPVNSFSVAKSFTNALLGILVRQGRLTVDRPVPVAQWQHASDPRARIRLEDLLRMDSGLDAAEVEGGFDPADQMLYNRNDDAAYVAGRPALHPPGMVWDYTSANTLLLDRAIGDAIGGGPEGLRRFTDKELFEPLHMHSVTMEFDGAGTFIGANHLYATPRDFARFGQLYVDDGVAPDGHRILPSGWVAWSRTATLGKGYGAGFWTNDGPGDDAAWRVAHGFPKDGFYASGNLGQRIYIVPGAHLVMVRIGYSRGPDFGLPDDLRLLKVALEETGKPALQEQERGWSASGR